MDLHHLPAGLWGVPFENSKNCLRNSTQNLKDSRFPRTQLLYICKILGGYELQCVLNFFVLLHAQEPVETDSACCAVNVWHLSMTSVSDEVHLNKAQPPNQNRVVCTGDQRIHFNETVFLYTL